MESKGVIDVLYLGVVAGREGRAAAVAQEDLADTVDSGVQSVVGQVAVVGVEHDQMDCCISAPPAVNIHIQDDLSRHWCNSSCH